MVEWTDLVGRLEPNYVENFCRNCNIIIYFTSSFFRVLFQATRLAQILGKRLEERRKEKQREEERDTHMYVCIQERGHYTLYHCVYSLQAIVSTAKHTHIVSAATTETDASQSQSTEFNVSTGSWGSQ